MRAESSFEYTLGLLERSNQFTLQILDDMTDLVVFTDLSGSILFANHRFRVYLNKSHANVIGKKLSSLLSKDVESDIRDLMDPQKNVNAIEDFSTFTDRFQ